MSISTQDSPVEKQIISPEDTNSTTQIEKEGLCGWLKNCLRNPFGWFERIWFEKLWSPLSQEIFALKKDEEGQEKYQDPTISGHMLLIVIQLILAGFLSLSFTGFAFYKASIWMKELEDFNHDKTPRIFLNQESKINQEKDQNESTEIKINKAQENRIVQQFNEIKANADMHYNIAIDLYQRRYIAMSMALVLGSTSVLCLILISRLGWEKVHKGIVNIFLITATLAIFYGDISQVYQHKKNIDHHALQYKNYINLGNSTLSYLANQNDIKVKKKDSKESIITPKEFINKVDDSMAELNRIYLIFDNTSIDQMQQKLRSSMPELDDKPPEAGSPDDKKNSSQTDQQQTKTEVKSNK